MTDRLDVSIPRAELARRTSAAISRSWPDLSAMVRLDRSRIEDLHAVRRALSRAARPGIRPDDRDLLRYGAHLWLAGCDSLPGWSKGVTTAVRAILSALGDFGVRIVRTQQEGDWCYDGALADSLAKHPGRGQWADFAFLELMDRGWESHCALCGSDKPFGPDYFVPVIEHGEAYLSAHPSGRIAELVALRVAEAHETAWSLSKARPDDDYITARKYVLQAPRHREQALALYERFLAGKPASVKPALRERLRRMRLDIDTNFHKYWCVWD